MDINNLWSGYDLNSKKQNTRCLAVNTILEGKDLMGTVLGNPDEWIIEVEKGQG